MKSLNEHIMQQLEICNTTLKHTGGYLFSCVTHSKATCLHAIHKYTNEMPKIHFNSICYPVYVSNYFTKRTTNGYYVQKCGITHCELNLSDLIWRSGLH